MSNEKKREEREKNGGRVLRQYKKKRKVLDN
jgi:hypothetical protein